MVKKFPQLIKTNRFSVKFPNNWGMRSDLVQSINKPSYNAEFGFDVPHWDNVFIKITDYITEEKVSISSQALKLIDNCNGDIIELNILDDANNIIETWEIEIEYLSEIFFSKFDYNIQEANTIDLVFCIKNCKIK